MQRKQIVGGSIDQIATEDQFETFNEFNTVFMPAYNIQSTMCRNRQTA